RQSQTFPPRLPDPPLPALHRFDYPIRPVHCRRDLPFRTTPFLTPVESASKRTITMTDNETQPFDQDLYDAIMAERGDVYVGWDQGAAGEEIGYEDAARVAARLAAARQPDAAPVVGGAPSDDELGKAVRKVMQEYG